MNRIKSFKDLHAWQKSMEFAAMVYEITAEFPKEERYGIVSQMRRAAISIPSNIAEGHSRNTTGEFVQFLGIAKGSLAELETLILMSIRLGYIDELPANNALEPCAVTGRLLNGLVRSLKA